MPLRSSPWQQKAHTGTTATKPTCGISEKVNIPKTKKTYCKNNECWKHTLHKVTQCKKGDDSLSAQEIELQYLEETMRAHKSFYLEAVGLH
ncbi:hypothetical protein BDA96_05G044600 [Sorghum bicolor]|uniref:Uncharacterized protein n=1 Tax=Sorghum bicolor TaxID=4558 RepID=A0A921UE90_SORBI|nr:hypothetical protein BDA96_05G044600 [Sorghum bicolor]